VTSAWDAAAFSAAVLAWFDQHGRHDLPWQQDPSPYRVWISEIMLQQTQVAVVIPYFERFMARFPDLPRLAAADLDEVLRQWSGLGYYARARHLHAAACVIRDHHQGRFPTHLKVLQALPGIGRSTAGAILSLAFGLPEPILDGNVKRVLARAFTIPGWPGQSAVLARLWALAEDLLATIDPQPLEPGNRISAYNQALMDFGATLCMRSAPACGHCPLQSHCLAYATGSVRQYPAPKPKGTKPIRTTRWLLVRDPSGRLLLEQRPPTGLWGGLWIWPDLARDQNWELWCWQHLGAKPQRVEKLARRRHSFSHFALDIEPVLIELDWPPSRIAEDGRWLWIDAQAAGELALPAPVRRLLEEITKHRNIAMPRHVNCIKLGHEAEGLERPPYPGPLGQRIFAQVSKQAWGEWLKHQTMLINENRLSPMNPKDRQFLEQQLEAFFFGEGADLPQGYVPPAE
jgi:A/G-specific adenine glycosylase